MKITIDAEDLDAIPEMIKAAIVLAPQSPPLNHPVMTTTIIKVLAATARQVTLYIQHMKERSEAA